MMITLIFIIYPKFKTLSLILPIVLTVNSFLCKILQDHNDFIHFKTKTVATIYFIHFRTKKGYNSLKLAKNTIILWKIKFSLSNSKFGVNVLHTPLSTFCEFQLIQTNRKQDVSNLVVKPVDILITLYTRQYQWQLTHIQISKV